MFDLNCTTYNFFSDYPANSYTDYAPGAPPFNDSVDMQLPEAAISSNVRIPEMTSAHVAAMTGGAGGSGGGRPTLKDYLDMMKANKMPLPGKQTEGD